MITVVMATNSKSCFTVRMSSIRHRSLAIEENTSPFLNHTSSFCKYKLIFHFTFTSRVVG